MNCEKQNKKVKIAIKQFAEKIILDRLLKMAQMQGARNPEDRNDEGPACQPMGRCNAADGRFSATC